VYEFKLLLLDVAPAIWRRIQVPETYSFWDFHVALQDSMGWLDCHLHRFRVSELVTGEAVEIGIPDDDPFVGDEPMLPGWEVPIANYFSHPGVVARYHYDFGDGWEHELILEAIVKRQRGTKYPLCLGGARACPPEDCGGVGGYENLLTVIGTPTHEEYESTLEWLGGRFDPEKFDPRSVRFDDPARRYELAFGQPLRRRRPGRRSMRPQLIQPDERIPVRLTAGQRDLILDHTFIDSELEKLLRVAVTDAASIVVGLTLDDLDDLLGHVAAQANHSKDAKLRKRLETLSNRLRDIEQSHTDNPPAVSFTAILGAPKYTPKQGQYLTFIYYYTKIHARAPSESDFQRYFKVSPPAVHRMVLTLEDRGFIERSPGESPSFRLLLGRSELPDLE
jgi:DNA-binding MarR family transcriptional regulator